MTTQALKKWNKVKLGDVAEIESGGTPSSTKSEYWDGGNICWATLPDLKNKYIFDTQRKITPLGLKNSSAKLLPINSVIFSSRATIGEVSIAKVEISTNQGSKNFICNPTKIDYEFLYYLLKSKVEEINSLASGATYKEINKTVFSSVEVEIPNIPTQKQIADVLSTYDDLIENNTKRIKILEEIAQAMYTEWFSEKENISMVGKLSDVGKLIREKYNEKTDQDLPLVDMARMKTKSLSLSEFGKSTDLTTSRIIFEEGDILFGSIRAYLHKVTLAPFKGITNISVFVFRSIKTNLASFLTITLFREETIAWANQYSAGTKMPVIKGDLFLTMPVSIPKEDVLKRLEEIINPMLEEIKNLTVQNFNLKKTRDLLLPKLVTGEIRI